MSDGPKVINRVVRYLRVPSDQGRELLAMRERAVTAERRLSVALQTLGELELEHERTRVELELEHERTRALAEELVRAHARIAELERLSQRRR